MENTCYVDLDYANPNKVIDYIKSIFNDHRDVQSQLEISFDTIVEVREAEMAKAEYVEILQKMSKETRDAIEKHDYFGEITKEYNFNIEIEIRCTSHDVLYNSLHVFSDSLASMLTRKFNCASCAHFTSLSGDRIPINLYRHEEPTISFFKHYAGHWNNVKWIPQKI